MVLEWASFEIIGFLTGAFAVFCSPQKRVSVVTAMTGGAILWLVVTQSYFTCSAQGDAIFSSLVGVVLILIYGSLLGLLFIGSLRIIENWSSATTNDEKSGWIFVAISIVLLLPMLFLRFMAHAGNQNWELTTICSIVF